MEKLMEAFWKLRLAGLKDALEKNNFEVYPAENVGEARSIVAELIFPKTGAASVSWGGSMTLLSSGLVEHFKSIEGVQVIDTFEKNLPVEEVVERRRQALLADFFITGTNAVTESGVLVNLDMIGNRVGAITFGPRHVVLLVGRNKIVPDLKGAMMRVRNHAAPMNVMRLQKKNPCAATSFCADCNSPDRICNTWVITEKSFPKGRIKVVLINEDLGL